MIWIETNKSPMPATLLHALMGLHFKVVGRHKASAAVLFCRVPVGVIVNVNDLGNRRKKRDRKGED